MDYQTLLSETQDGIALIRMNHPKKMNALGAELRKDLLACLEALDRDEGVRVLVLTGSGKSFCAGGDIQELKDKRTVSQARAYVRQVSRIISAIRNLEKPVIGAVNGAAVGAGFSLAMACDLIVASEKAFFSMAFVKIGLVPDLGTTYFAPRLFGSPKAKEMAFLGQTLSAQDLYNLGFINALVDPEALEPKALDLARQIAAGPPLALGLTKKMMNQSWDLNLETALEVEAQSQAACMQSEDFHEGVGAFYEKRPPRFQGK
jgi:2-(1,2-epoxy-1,2-dihydrophenyl)acetyl-CoA isomerase